MRYRLSELQALPTISHGQDADLKIETKTRRVWLSRMTVADGMPYNNMVTIEQSKTIWANKQRVKTVWQTVEQYEAK